MKRLVLSFIFILTIAVICISQNPIDYMNKRILNSTTLVAISVARTKKASVGILWMKRNDIITKTVIPLMIGVEEWKPSSKDLAWQYISYDIYKLRDKKGMRVTIIKNEEPVVTEIKFSRSLLYGSAAWDDSLRGIIIRNDCAKLSSSQILRINDCTWKVFSGSFSIDNYEKMSLPVDVNEGFFSLWQNNDISFAEIYRDKSNLTLLKRRIWLDIIPQLSLNNISADQLVSDMLEYLDRAEFERFET